MLKIVVISDTHGRNDILNILEKKHSDAQLFIHCGDLEDDPRRYPSWIVVKGNNDYWGQFRDDVCISAGMHRIYVVHSHRIAYSNRSKHHDGNKNPDVGWIHRNEEEGNREYSADDGGDGKCLALGAHPLCELGREAAEDHTCHFTKGHENSVVDDKSAYGDIAMEAIFHQITSHSISESVKEIGANSNKREIDPWFVLKQVSKRLEGEFLCTNWF